MKNFLPILSILLFPAIGFANWQMSHSGFETKEVFSSSETYELYTGDSVIEENEKKAKAGFKFVLTNIQVQNDDAQAPYFRSKEIFLKADGKTYQRIKDDKFLKEYNVTPFTQLTLKKGTHKGAVLFEIPQNANTENLELLYQDKIINISK